MIPGGEWHSYNQAIRRLRASDYEAAIADPVVTQALEWALEHPESEGRRIQAIVVAGSLRLGGMAPSLVRVAEQTEVNLWTRLHAVRIAYLLDPGSDLPGRWIKNVVQERAFVTWERGQVVRLIRMLSMLTVDDATACADTIQQWVIEAASEKHSIIPRTLERIRATIDWTRQTEALPCSGRVEAIIDGERKSDRFLAALRLLIPEDCRAQFVEEIRCRQEDRIGTDRDRRRMLQSLTLLDALGEEMTPQQFDLYRARLLLCRE